MIELLILYVINNREKTLYSLRADIIEKFGYFTRPSIGTIHPALKRLLTKSAVTIRNNFSEGGKKSTYYGSTANSKKVFRDLFFEHYSENPTLFFTELQTKISVMSMLDNEQKLEFLNDALLKLESFSLDLKNTYEDEYIDFEPNQRALLKKNISDVKSYIEFLKSVKESL